jgi:predicted DNA-binding protein
MPAPYLRISTENQERLNKLKSQPRESCDMVIRRLLDRMTDPESLTEMDLDAIAESLEEIRDGIYFTIKNAGDELGLL